MPHHIEDGPNIGSQPGHITPDKQSGRSCTGSDVFSKVLIFWQKKELHRVVQLMMDASKKLQNLDEQRSCYLARCLESER